MTDLRAVVDAMLGGAPRLARAQIRVDGRSKRASVIDVIRLVTGSAANASEVLLRLDRKLTTRCEKIKIDGKGRSTPVADAATLVEIIWDLPGKAAKAFRRQSARYVCHGLCGDESSIQHAPDKVKEFFARENVELKQLEMQNLERRVALRERTHAIDQAERSLDSFVAARELEVHNARMQFFQALGQFDDRTKILLADTARTGLKRIVTGAANEPNPDAEEISIPLICQELKVAPKGKEGLIGKKAKSLWQAKYSTTDDPPTRTSLFHGKAIRTFHYTRKDADVLEAAVRSTIHDRR